MSGVNYKVEPLMHVMHSVEKWTNYFKIKSMFSQFSTLYMKGLILYSKKHF